MHVSRQLFTMLARLLTRGGARRLPSMSCSWLQRERPPYELNKTFWRKIGVQAVARRRHNDKYSCPAHQLHDYSCAPRFASSTSCQALLRNTSSRQILFVGDSTSGQLFISFVLQLGGNFGSNSAFAHTLVDLAASACDDRVRLEYVRNDLLLWSNDRSDLQNTQRCTGYSLCAVFLRRSLMADHVVLSVGQHFPIAVTKFQGGARFIRASLNHTFHQLVHARSALGHAPSSSTMVTPLQPVPFCSRHSRPAEQVTPDVAAEQAAVSNLTYSRHWAMMPEITRWATQAAQCAGMSVVDVLHLSAQRPDGTMATEQRRVRNGTRGDTAELTEDCVHSCMPGPVDTYSAFVLDAVLRASPRSVGLTEPLTRSTTLNGGSPLLRAVRDALTRPPLNDGFFALTRAQWLDLNRSAQVAETNNSEAALECSLGGCVMSRCTKELLARCPAVRLGDR